MNTEIKSLNILSIGAGAIGTYIGGSLALHDNKVVFLEQPEVARDIRERGLRLNLRGVEHHVTTAEVVGHLDEAVMLGPFDVALFALKAYHTQPAIEGMAAYADRLPPFLCLQNGLENEAALAQALGEDKVIAASVTTAIRRRAAGDVALERLRGLGIAGGHPLSKHLVAAFNTAGLKARAYPRAAGMKWSKLLTNLIANASSAILDMTPAEIFADPVLFQLEMRQLRECLAVMRAKRIGVVSLPGTPVRALAFAIRSLPLGISRPLLARAIGGGRGGKMPSFHIDLHSGSGRSEVDYLNGAVVRVGEELGIDAPVNRFLRDTLLALTNGEIPLDAFRRKPDEMLKQLPA